MGMQRSVVSKYKKGGSKGVPNVGAGKTTTDVTNNYKNYKAPKNKPQVAKVKRGKGKL
jgi:hypothetical protein